MGDFLTPFVQDDFIRLRIEPDSAQECLVVSRNRHRKIDIESFDCAGTVVSEFFDEMKRHLPFVPLRENILAEDFYLVYFVVFIIRIPECVFSPGQPVGKRAVGS